MLSRRHFLHSAGALLACTASPKIFAQPKYSALFKSASSQLANYEKKIGDTFYARAEHSSLALKLIDIEDKFENDVFQQFVLVFEAPNKHCEDELYNVTHIKSFTTNLLRLDKSDADKQLIKSRFCLLK